MANITVEFTDKKKIVRYHDGKSSEYPVEKIHGHRQELVKRKEMLERQIADIDKDLSGIDAERVKKQGVSSVEQG